MAIELVWWHAGDVVWKANMVGGLFHSESWPDDFPRWFSPGWISSRVRCAWPRNMSTSWGQKMNSWMGHFFNINHPKLPMTWQNFWHFFLPQSVFKWLTDSLWVGVLGKPNWASNYCHGLTPKKSCWSPQGPKTPSEADITDHQGQFELIRSLASVVGAVSWKMSSAPKAKVDHCRGLYWLVPPPKAIPVANWLSTPTRCDSPERQSAASWIEAIEILKKIIKCAVA